MLDKIIQKNISRNKIGYSIITILFLLGIIIGVICVNNLNDSSESREYFQIFKNNIKNLEPTNVQAMFFSTLINKFRFLFVIFVLTSSIIGVVFIYGAIVYKGFGLGYTISIILRVFGVKKGLLFAIISLAFQNIIFIPSIIFFSVYCINFGKKIKNKSVDIKREFLKLFIVFIVMLIIAMIASTMEMIFSYKILKKLQNFF